MKRPAPLTFAFVLFAFATFNSLSSSGSPQSVKPENQAERNESDGKNKGKKQASKTGPAQDKSRQLLHTKGANDTVAPVLDEDNNGARSFALLIGISSYKNLAPKAQLQFADEDARAMRDFLISPKGGFRPENVTLLVNEEATQLEIMRALEKLQNRAGPRDLAFIFFAGHGLVNRSNQAFLLTYDSLPDDLLPTAVEMDRLNSFLKNIRARSRVIFTDACHSGAISDLISQSDSSEMVRSVSVRSFVDSSNRGDQTAFIFSAASPTQSSWEIKALEHGLFTYHVLGGLDGKADRNADGLITSKELYDYVATQVQRDAEKEGRHQVPEFNPHYDPSIPLAVLNEEGQKLYREWLDSDPFVTRYVALFDEALKENRLIKPERDSAWDYYNFLKFTPSTPSERLKQMKEQLLAKLNDSAQSVIIRSPVDPAEWQEASSWLDMAHSLSTDKSLRPRQAYCSAMAAHFLGENGRAERECDAAMNMLEESNLKDPFIYLRLAQFYKKMERWEKARRGYKIAIEDDPKVDWIGEYADVLIQVNDLAEAETQLHRALRLNPNYTHGLKRLAEVLLRSDIKEKYAEAVEVAAKARQIEPEDIEIEDVYGWALLKSGNPSSAIDPLRKVAQVRLSDNKRRDTALLRLSQAYRGSGDLDRSISALREAEQRGSQSVAIFDEMSRRLEERGDLEGAIKAAEKSVIAVETNAPERADRLRRVAEHLERTGDLHQAALKYKDAARLSSDIKVNTLLDNKSRTLFYRAGRPQDVGPSPNRSVAPKRRIFDTGELLIVPGGREALERLTGVRIEASAEGNALATIFEACLQDAVIHSRLTYFYERYPEFARKMESKGVRHNERFELPASDKPASEAARDALAFFGVREKNGRRDINKKEFESKKAILEALGGDPERLERDETTYIVLKTNDFSMPLGMQQWVRWIKNGTGTRPQDLMLAFLRDPQAMRLFVGYSSLPEEAVEWIMVRTTSRENSRDVPAAIYFAGPYLRFTPEGHLRIPGGRQGEMNWQRALKVNTTDLALQALFKRENGRALYLFAALSSAGEVGDLIASSPLFDQLFQSLKESAPPSTREPFDLIDLLSFLRVESGKLRLPKAIELWLGAGQKEIDPTAVMMAKIEKLPAGRHISVARQIAVLDHIERLCPDWMSDSDRVAFIAKQVIAGREAQIEMALDLKMDWKQVEGYFAQIARIESISTPSLN
jgi:tetratricopeptide (TPR) repeat protein